jgi:hypothetical protein
MSWSVGAVGKPRAVKVALAAQFRSAKESTKHIPHEHASVGQIEGVVNGQLDFLAALKNPIAVQVSANGSAYTSSDGTGNTNVEMKVQPIHGFIEDLPAELTEAAPVGVCG